MSYYERTEIAQEIADAFKKIQQPQTKPEPPTNDPGFVKPGGWGSKEKNPAKWKVVNMKDDPKLFKIVDSKGKNIAANFITKEGAQKFIDYAKSLYDEDGDPDQPDETPDQPPEIPTPGGQLGPYPAKGPTLESTRRPKTGLTVRHYRSGKEDDKTMEHNVKGIKARRHQFITYVTIHSIEHDDNISLKLGGTHMGSGWFDNGVSFEAGQCCLGVEKKHPSTKTCVVKGPKIGSVLNKKVGIACSYDADTNKTELFTNTGSGWKKQVEGTNVANFNPNADTFECQLRIDGVEAVPTVHTAVVQPI
jgi:hypothetical protein